MEGGLVGTFVATAVVDCTFAVNVHLLSREWIDCQMSFATARTDYTDGQLFLKWLE